MTEEVKLLLAKIEGEPCTRAEVGQWKSISLGFGDEAQRKPNQRRAYRMWELGTYRSAWRLVQNRVILLGSKDTEDNGEMNHKLDDVKFGCFSYLRQVSDSDLRLELDNGVSIEFFTMFSDDDEAFHISCPEGIWVQFSLTEGWRIGPSDKPWAP